MLGKYPESGWYTETGDYPETVVLDLMAKLVTDEGDIPVHAVFRYDVSDPYAVRAAFSSPASPLVTWIFARELLTHGVLDVAGHGDVQVWRSTELGTHTVCIGLSSPDGHAILEVSGVALSTFLRKTFALCWPGDEHVHLDTDQAIEDLLAS